MKVTTSDAVMMSTEFGKALDIIGKDRILSFHIQTLCFGFINEEDNFFCHVQTDKGYKSFSSPRVESLKDFESFIEDIKNL